MSVCLLQMLKTLTKCRPLASTPQLTPTNTMQSTKQAMVMPGSPFRVKVSPGQVRAEKCTAKIMGFGTFKAGDDWRADITARDELENVRRDPDDIFTVTVKHLDTASGVLEQVPSIFLASNGTHRASVSVKISGTYKVWIRIKGSLISGFPVTFDVIPGEIYVPHCLEDNGEINSAVEAGTDVQVVVALMDKFHNAVINGPGADQRSGNMTD
ncbi:hypothetical protein BSKO_14149 [Bryopsis sp. KO-2023]|nr:hypothetical protein BSKO_14149 [Bryopsis sp. KO-2023]